MKKEIKFSLVFRDMWQSAGKYVPRVDQPGESSSRIIEMGCFARVETNGGGFEQVNLLFGENPNKAVREWTKPFHEAGIQTHMLDRALNGLRMSPVPADVRKLFYKVKKAQGTDITRTFCGLNDTRNIIPSIGYAHDAGMISQCSLCITHSPIHTVEYYTEMALKLIKQVPTKSASRIWQVSDVRFLWARLWPISRRRIPIFLSSIIVMRVPVSIWQVFLKCAKRVATIST